ncbi:MAG: hypothetical protein AB7F53_01355, partial [Nitrososphaeraceae archaeon]
AEGEDVTQQTDQEAQQQAEGEDVTQQTDQEAQQQAEGEDVTQLIQQKAEQLGVGKDIAQQIGQEATQIGAGQDVAQLIQQKAEQLGVGKDIAQQIGQEATQIGAGGNTQQEIGQQAQQQSFGSNIDQKITQTATQIAESAENLGAEDSSDVQQVINQIAQQAASGGGNVDQVINQIASQIAKDPNSDLSKSLGNLAGLYGSGNNNQVNQAIQQIGSQIAVGNDITQILIQVSNQITNNYFNNKVKIDIDDDDDNDNVKIIKKVYKRDNSCPTQSDSIQLKGKIQGKGVIVLADYDPCELKDGRATLNIPNNPNLKFVVLSIDKQGNEHEGAIVSKQKIQNINKDSGLYVVYFDDKMNGIDPVTGKKKIMDEINGLALYNTGTKSIDFKPGNSLALTAVLQK